MPRIERPVEARGQRIHSLSQSKFEIVDIDSIWQRAYRFSQAVVIVV